MNGRGSVIALTVTPSHLAGFSGVIGRDESFTQARRVAVDWEIDALDAAARSAALEKCVSELLPPSQHSTRAYIAVHPALLYFEQISVPPASRAEVQAFLGLLVNRRWPDKNGNAVRWSWNAIHGTGDQKQALLCLARGSLLQPIESAFAKHSIPVRRILPMPAALSQLQEGEKDYLLSIEQAEGVALSEFRDGGMATCSWLPAQVEGDALESSRLIEYMVPQDVKRVCVARDPAVEAALNGTHNVVQLDVEKRLKQLMPAVEWNSASVAEKAAAGLICLEHGKPPSCPDFSKSSRENFEFARRLNLQLPVKKASVLVGALALLLVMAIASRAAMESRWHKRALESASAVTINEDAVESNIAALLNIERDQRAPLDYLVDLKKSKPEGIMLESFEYDAKGNVVITGSTNAVSVVQQFTINLNKSRKFFQASTLSTKVDKDTVKFTIRCKLRKA